MNELFALCAGAGTEKLGAHTTLLPSKKNVPNMHNSQANPQPIGSTRRLREYGRRSDSGSLCVRPNDGGRCRCRCRASSASSVWSYCRRRQWQASPTVFVPSVTLREENTHVSHHGTDELAPRNKGCSRFSGPRFLLGTLRKHLSFLPLLTNCPS